MKTYIYFIRHGEVNNPEKIWYGRLPRFGLNPKGRLQIKKTAEFLSTQQISAIYSSPLLRARQTSQIIKNKLPFPFIHFSKNLLEAHSSMQGKKFSYIKSIRYNVYARPGRKITGETIEELAERMEKFISIVTKIHNGKRVAAVSHGDSIMMVRAIINKMPIENASLRPGEENYIKHGEVYLVECGNKNPVKIRSVFKPVSQ